MQNVVPKDQNLNFLKRIIKANIAGLIFILISLILIAGVFYAFAVSENLIPIFTYFISYMASLVVGVLSSRGASEKGYKNGLIAGSVYCIIMFVLSSFLNDKSVIQHIIKITICLIISTLGGIIGINLKTKKIRR